MSRSISGCVSTYSDTAAAPSSHNKSRFAGAGTTGSGITNSFASGQNNIATSATIEGIVHNYQDHANEDARPHLLHQLILESTVARNRAEHPFPIKLHYVLGKVAEDGLSHVVSWQPHGRCFLVHDQKESVNRPYCQWRDWLGLYCEERKTARP